MRYEELDGSGSYDNLSCFLHNGSIGYSAERWNHVDEVAQAEMTAEEQERREQAAYYKGWQDGKQYYLENFGG